MIEYSPAVPNASAYVHERVCTVYVCGCCCAACVCVWVVCLHYSMLRTVTIIWGGAQFPMNRSPFQVPKYVGISPYPSWPHWCEINDSREIRIIHDDDVCVGGGEHSRLYTLDTRSYGTHINIVWANKQVINAYIWLSPTSLFTSQNDDDIHCICAIPCHISAGHKSYTDICKFSIPHTSISMLLQVLVILS